VTTNAVKIKNFWYPATVYCKAVRKISSAAKDSEGPGGCLAMSLRIAVLLLRLFLTYSYVPCVDRCAVTLLCVDLLVWTNECSCFKVQISVEGKMRESLSSVNRHDVDFKKKPALFLCKANSYPSSYCTKSDKASSGMLSCSVHLELGKINSESRKKTLHSPITLVAAFARHSE